MYNIILCRLVKPKTESSYKLAGGQRLKINIDKNTTRISLQDVREGIPKLARLMMDQLALIIAKMSDRIISFFRFGSFEKDIFILLQIEIYVRITDPSLFRTITSIIISTRLGLALYTAKKMKKTNKELRKHHHVQHQCFVI